MNVNAYHQPGVEAGKKAATRLLELQARACKTLPKAPGETAGELARALKRTRRMCITFFVTLPPMITRIGQHRGRRAGPRRIFFTLMSPTAERGIPKRYTRRPVE